jgi:hypothetical protein
MRDSIISSADDFTDDNCLKVPPDAHQGPVSILNIQEEYSVVHDNEKWLDAENGLYMVDSTRGADCAMRQHS